MSVNSWDKPWFFPTFYAILEDTDLKPGEKIVLLNLVGRSNVQGLYWIQREKQATQTALTREGQAKILKRLQQKGYLDIREIRPGDLLPSGHHAKRVCFAHQLTAKVIESNKAEQRFREQRSIEPDFKERKTGEHGSRKQNTTTQGNSTPPSGERRSAPLHVLDLKKIKKEKRARTTDQSLNLKQRLKKLSLEIREKQPINPHMLRMLVAEAKEDRVPLPPELEEALSLLQKHELIEMTRLGKIEHVAWTEPTPLPVLLKEGTSLETTGDLSALVAETILKLRL